MSKKQRLSLLLVGLLLFSLVYQPSLSFAEPQNNYSSHWAKGKIQSAINGGIIAGYQDGNFYPDKEITRAEFVAIMNRAFGYKELGQTPFKDVSESAWHSRDVAIAYKAGYINGTSQETFSPDSLVTREQVCVMIANILKLTDTSPNKSLNDVDSISAWAKNSVLACLNAGVISGYSDGTFRGQNPITRAESVVVIASGRQVKTKIDYEKSQNAPQDKVEEEKEQIVPKKITKKPQIAVEALHTLSQMPMKYYPWRLKG